MGRLLCLLYHRVNRIKDNIYDLAVNPDEFEEQIKYLQQNYRILRFEEEWSDVIEDSVVITFDDGYADNYLHALPILEKYKVPATIFVSTGNIGTKREFWWDEIGRVLTAKKNYPKQFHLQDRLYEYTWNTETEDQRIELTRTLRWLLRMEPDDIRANEWLKELKLWAGIDSDRGRDANLSLSKEQLISLAKSPYITIGAHTVRHLSLGALSDAEQEKEIGDSIGYLERELGQKIDFFSYPFGSARDYNHATIKLCKENGIKKAATTKAAAWDPSGNMLEIPRFSVKNGNLQMLINGINDVMGK